MRPAPTPFPAVFVRFDEAVVAVEVPSEAVREAARTLFEPLLAEGAPGPPPAERIVVTEAGGRYAVRPGPRFSDRHGLPRDAPDLASLARLLKVYVLQALMDATPDRLWLRAAAVADGDRAVLIVGPRGGGADALAAAFGAAGWASLSADVVPLGELLAFPFLPGAPSGPLPVSARAGVAVAAVVFPEPDADASDAQATRVPRDNATLALLRSLLDLDRHSAVVAEAAAFVDRTPAVRLRYSDPAQAASLVARLLDGSAQPADPDDADPVGAWFQTMPVSADATARPGGPAPGVREVAPPARAEWEPWEWPVGRRTLTVGMAVYDDYDGAYFTLQALRLYHPEVADRVEFLVVDNDPDGPAGEALRRLAGPAARCRVVPNRTWRGPAASKDLVFREARTPYVLCIDAHVLLAPGALRRLLDYVDDHPDTPDFLQGPFLDDDFFPATHMEARLPGPPDAPNRTWAADAWALDARGLDPDSPPFEIPAHGCGLFACRREAWPGVNPRLAGFAAEEGYLHEKVRRRGGRTLCLPFLGWMHRFERPHGVPYPNTWPDRVRNHAVCFDELGLDPALLAAHYRTVLGEDADRVLALAQAALCHPLAAFDAIYGAGMDDAGWQALLDRLAPLGLDHRVRRLPPTGRTGAAGRALAHTRVVEEARRHGLRHVLVLSDAAALPDADALARLGDVDAPGWAVRLLGRPPGPATAAVAYECSAFDRVLAALPDDEASPADLDAVLARLATEPPHGHGA